MKSIKLLQAANSECTEKVFIIRMCECVKDRLLKLQIRTSFYPTSANEETLSEWEEIAEVADDILKKYKDDEIDDELEEVIDTPKQSKKKIIVDKSKTAKCPQCGGNLVFEGGCNTCKDCGWSKCD